MRGHCNVPIAFYSLIFAGGLLLLLSPAVVPATSYSIPQRHRRHGTSLLLSVRGGDATNGHLLLPAFTTRGGDIVAKRHQGRWWASFSSSSSSSALQMADHCGSSPDALRGGDDVSSIITTTTTNSNLQGIYYMTLASLSFSLMFLGVKLFSNAPTFTLIFYRSVVQALLSGLLLAREGIHPLGDRDVRPLLIQRAAFGSVAVAAFFYAVQCLPLPDAITLQFTTPVFAALLAVPFLGEAWKRSNQVGAAVCLVGVLLISRPSWLFGATVAEAAAVGGTTASATAATLVGLAGAAFAGLAYVLVRVIGSRAPANVMVFYYGVFSSLTAPLGAKLLSGDGTWNVLGSPSPSELLAFAGLGVFGFLGQLFTNMGLTACSSAATATLLTNTQIVFAFLFEVTILRESLSPWSVAGSLLIVGYMALTEGISMMKAKEKTKDVLKKK